MDIDKELKNKALQRLRDKYNCKGLNALDDKFEVSLGEISAELGLIQAYSKILPDETSGQIYKKNNQYYIEANRNHHPNRRRFTVAHELGHYLLHKDVLDEKGEILERSDKIYNEEELQMEREANEFAAELLMPEYKIKELFKDIKMITKLAEYFFVSEIALECRLINLGLIHGGF